MVSMCADCSRRHHQRAIGIETDVLQALRRHCMSDWSCCNLIPQFVAPKNTVNITQQVDGIILAMLKVFPKARVGCFLLHVVPTIICLNISYILFNRLCLRVVHLKLGRQWKVIAFHMFCVDRRICTLSI
jgi:hypothetical protein